MNCPICGKEFNKGDMETHLQTKHKIEDIASELTNMLEEKNVNIINDSRVVLDESIKPFTRHRKRFF